MACDLGCGRAEGMVEEEAQTVSVRPVSKAWSRPSLILIRPDFHSLQLHTPLAVTRLREPICACTKPALN